MNSSPSKGDRERRRGAWAMLAVAAILAPRALAHGDLHEQIARLSKRIARSPERAGLYQRRGDLYRRHRDWRAARADLATARRLAPGLKGLDFSAALVEFDTKRHATALALLDRQLATDPHHLQARLCRARTLVALRRVADALRDYDGVLRDSKEPRPGHYLERARTQLGAGTDAAAVLRGLDEGIERLGPLVSLQAFAVELELKRRDRRAALRRIDRTLATLPFGGPWLLRRGQVLELLGRRREARQAYATGLRQLTAIPASRRNSKTHRALEQRLRRAMEHVSAPPIAPRGPSDERFKP